MNNVVNKRNILKVFGSKLQKNFENSYLRKTYALFRKIRNKMCYFCHRFSSICHNLDGKVIPFARKPQLSSKDEMVAILTINHFENKKRFTSPRNFDTKFRFFGIAKKNGHSGQTKREPKVTEFVLLLLFHAILN